MAKTKPAETPGQPALPLGEETRTPERPAGNSGLNTLLQGSRNGQGPADPSGEHGSGQPRLSSLTWTLLAADALLVILAVWQVATRRGRLGFWGSLLTILAVGLGGWLGCSAFLLRRRGD